MRVMQIETIESTMAAVGTKATYAGASVSGLGWFLSNEFFGLAGVGIGLAGLFISWHYKRKALRLHEREHELRASLLRRWLDVDSGMGELGADE